MPFSDNGHGYDEDAVSDNGWEVVAVRILDLLLIESVSCNSVNDISALLRPCKSAVEEDAILSGLEES